MDEIEEAYFAGEAQMIEEMQRMSEEARPTIERHRLQREKNAGAYMEPAPDGNWVTYSDHAAELARVEGERDSLGHQYNDFMRSLGVLSLGIDADEWALPSAHGNDRLRWAVLICQRIERLKTDNILLRAECEAWRARRGGRGGTRNSPLI